MAAQVSASTERFLTQLRDFSMYHKKPTWISEQGCHYLLVAGVRFGTVGRWPDAVKGMGWRPGFVNYGARIMQNLVWQETVAQAKMEVQMYMASCLMGSLGL